MKKWILIILSSIFIVVIWQVISIYHTAMSPVREEKNEAVSVVMQEANLQTIKEVYTYNGTVAYTIVLGVNTEDEELIIWIDENKEIAFTAKADEGVPKEEVLKYLNTDRNPSEIIAISLAMEKNIPLWEIKFMDQSNRYNLYYIKFEDGEYYQRITF